MVNLAKLRWQCRRGTLELDLLLLRYLEQRYSSASTVEQQQFVQLLQLEDDVLIRLLLGDCSELEVTPVYQTVVRKIRGVSSG